MLYSDLIDLSHAYVEIQNRDAEIERLTAENERLRAAAKPFVNAANYFDKHRLRFVDDDTLLHHESIDAEARITLGQLRALRTAHQQSPNTET